MTFRVQIVHLSRHSPEGEPPAEMLPDVYATVDAAHSAAREALARHSKGDTYRIFDADDAPVDDRGHKFPKRPRDPNQLAKYIVDVASGEIETAAPTAKETRAAKAGAKGGPARARALTPEQRSEIASAAASARWKKS